MRNYIVNYILRRVGRKLLLLLTNHPMETLGAAISRAVIYEVLLTDLNLIGGRSITMNASDARVVSVEEDEIILEIPLQHRKASNISTVQVIFRDEMGNASHGGYRDTQRASGRDPMDMINGNSGFSSHTELNVVNNSFISIKQAGIRLDAVLASQLTFEVEYSKDFDEIDGAYHHKFGEIAETITKMLIYNLELEVDEAYTHNSRVSEKLINKVSSFEDEPAKYSAYITKLGKFSHLNNRAKMERLTTRSI